MFATELAPFHSKVVYGWLSCFTQIIDHNIPKSLILGNYSDLIVDIGEDVLLECDTSNDTKSFEWFRKEDNWFNEEITEQRIFGFSEQYLLVNENKVSTVLYKYCLRGDEPYATVWDAKCDRVVLNITYPYSQHGFNSSTKVWGNVLCNDEIGGFQIWVVGYGILKRFLPQDMVAIDRLTPGKSYCFNGWAYNSCGAGPVFTLEGVCAENAVDCETTSTEHCEYDFNYNFD
ncbi:unnamed protein product [Medioppia subpectinata]|uniref:Ig-like domain-containing protein n=1 Tax=Medioppia subpectinata TaxID=1979941 RepID=A0A7R9Q9G8_9ACAR|nr:unnamed protein product [Medioppia subpectinata]CAG2116690.1 unnamed protein product [Medioppia subpectinata]